MLQHFEVIRAKASLQPLCGLRPKQGWNGWATMAATLESLAFQAADPWLQMGLSPQTGAEVSEAGLEQRWNIARTLLQARRKPLGQSLTSGRLREPWAGCARRLRSARGYSCLCAKPAAGCPNTLALGGPRRAASSSRGSAR